MQVLTTAPKRQPSRWRTLRETGRAVPGQKAESGQTRDTGRATEKHGHLATQTRSRFLTNISRLCERRKKALYTYIENSYIDRTITEYTSGPWPGLRRGPGPSHAARRESVHRPIALVQATAAQLCRCIYEQRQFFKSFRSADQRVPQYVSCHARAASSRCPSEQ